MSIEQNVVANWLKSIGARRKLTSMQVFRGFGYNPRASFQGKTKAPGNSSERQAGTREAAKSLSLFGGEIQAKR
jgi:hypothetical protein